MTADEYKTEFSMWAILASPLTVTTPIVNCSTGTCVASITPLQQEILLNTDIIAINQDDTPAGRLVSAPSSSDDWLVRADCAMTKQLSQASCTEGTSFGCYASNQSMWTAAGCRGVFTCDGVAGVNCNVMNSQFAVCDCKAPAPKAAMVYARNLTDHSVAVALYNPEDVAGTGSVDFSLLGWPADMSATVRDLWAHKDLGKVTGSYPASGTVPVPAHATVVLRLYPARA